MASSVLNLLRPELKNIALIDHQVANELGSHLRVVALEMDGQVGKYFINKMIGLFA